LSDEETQEQLVADTADTPVEYLEKSVTYFREDYPGEFMPHGGQINLRARVIASVDGNLPNKLAWDRKREELALGAGRAKERIGSTVGEMEQGDPNQERSLNLRAREIREEGKLVPNPGPFECRALSRIAAMIELGGSWELSEEHGRRLDKVMHEHEVNGGDAAWWWKERKAPTTTRRGNK
jgi:hypothetical protein